MSFSTIEKKPKNPGEMILQVKDLHAENDKGLKALNGVSLNVRAGEIVGLAGVAGNGQRELAQVITGLRKCFSGEILFKHERLTNQSALFGILRGVAHIPEDRTQSAPRRI